MFGPLYDDMEPPDGLEAANAPPAGGPPAPPASIRSRLHVICALYAHTPQPDRRLALLDHLERLTLEAAEALAAHMLASGWRPRTPDGDRSEAA
ncbi:hypothetical protein [Phenylobacterium sp.]|jgi:hypothetical protein|uniref:hypothetical protein n=1 Tax=Phenylobacterium sp. TaxID=1871053 RepID=UPI0035B115C6